MLQVCLTMMISFSSQILIRSSHQVKVTANKIFGQIDKEDWESWGLHKHSVIIVFGFHDLKCPLFVCCQKFESWIIVNLPWILIANGTNGASLEKLVAYY